MGGKDQKSLTGQMHTTGHATFTSGQMAFLAQHYKNELKSMACLQRKTEMEPTQIEVAPVQKEVSEEERAVIYSGISKEGQGRSEYLKTQAHKAPSARFRAPMTSSQMIGWDAGAVMFNKSPYAKKQIIRDSFERKRGVFVFDSGN
eukprot:NODE_2617_length_667_cov_62.320388_g2151_i0.p1 GENE.NODE_2617_length_667_cov_62.320388_g2151_i0~~NODE_2617_length_667_cov_62.320388_g2151_i0.p1  ORF type:complete len:146 (+),score=29.17 NODE_2617_length_667_cov_62.320388_g2151_i0:91-528(+)